MRLSQNLSIVFLVFALALSACAPAVNGSTGQLNAVASTQIVGDVVRAIGGELVSVIVLIPPDTDPHSFEPAPQDAAQLAEADLIFVNGLGLEESLQSLLDTQSEKVTAVSDGVVTIEFAGDEEFAAGDPHAWMNPQNVKIWVDNIANALGSADPANAANYVANAEAYKAELDELDAWAMEQIAQIPAEERVLVTDHESFGYFADHYGFEIVGAVIPSSSTLSEPSAGELAELESAIQQFGVKAIFVGLSTNPALAEQVAADTGIQLVPVYTESLSDADGPASSYLEIIRFDVEAVVAALKP